MQLRWETNNHSNLVHLQSNPITASILEQKRKGMTRTQIIEDLIKKGYNFRNIRNAYKTLAGQKDRLLDWRSPTAINETSRKIRNDVRKRKVSFTLAMKILINARNNLATMIKNPRGDDRIKQFYQEIGVTRKLKDLYGNPLMVKNYHIF